MKKNNKKILIISITIISIIILLSLIIFIVVIPQTVNQNNYCPTACPPLYISTNGLDCYGSCGLNNVNSCSPQAMAQLIMEYSPNDKIYTDSKCTVPYSGSSCISNWRCNDWSSCSKGQQKRTCTNYNKCSTTQSPITTQSCSCNPIWQTGNWGSCKSGTQTRTVKDTNNCGTISGMPSLTQNCTQQSSSSTSLYGSLAKFFNSFISPSNNALIINTLTTKQRPLVTGLQLTMYKRYSPGSSSMISNGYCTLGLIVHKSGKPYILTAGHCLASSGWQPTQDDMGVTVDQGNSGLGGIGQTYSFDNFTSGTDSGLISINSDVNYLQKDALNNVISGFKKGTDGMLVYKVGATTGLTYGTITKSNIYNIGTNGNYLEMGIQGNKGSFCAEGDSGSAVITSSSPPKIVGIISSYNATYDTCYAYQINDIADRLNIKF